MAKETEEAAILRRREQSRVYEIASKAFSRSDVDIEDILAKHSDPAFRKMLADAYDDIEQEYRDREDFNHFADSY